MEKKTSLTASSLLRCRVPIEEPTRTLLARLVTDLMNEKRYRPAELVDKIYQSLSIEEQHKDIHCEIYKLRRDHLQAKPDIQWQRYRHNRRQVLTPEEVPDLAAIERDALQEVESDIAL